MDMTELLDMKGMMDFPHLRRQRQRRTALVIGATALALVLLERCNHGVSRTGKAVKRAISAAFASWLEDHGGLPLFTLEGEEPPGGTTSALDLSQLYKRYALTRRISQDLPAGPAAAAAGLPTVASVINAASGCSDGELATQLSTHPTPATVEPASFWPIVATPNFFQSTKFFACLDVEEARELFQQTTQVQLRPREVLFRSGESSDSGIFIVVQGTLGVFLEDTCHREPVHANTLRYGESVGDLDVVDGACRSVTCIALEDGCLLVQVPQKLFRDFVTQHPRALLLYLQQGIARLWRVAHFMLSDFLQLPLHRMHEPSAAAPGQSSGAGGASCVRADGKDLNQGGPHHTVSRQSSAPWPGDLAVAASRAMLSPVRLGSAIPLAEPTSASSSISAAASGGNTVGADPQVSELTHAPSLARDAARSDVPPEAATTAAADDSDVPVLSSSRSASVTFDLSPGQLERAGGSAPASPTRVTGTWSSLRGASAAYSSARTTPLLSALKPSSSLQSSITAPSLGAETSASSQAPSTSTSSAPSPPSSPLVGAASNGGAHSVFGGGSSLRRSGYSAPVGTSPFAPSRVGTPLSGQRLLGQEQARPAGPSCRYPRSASLASALLLGRRACLAGGWDVVDVEELQVDDDTWAAITDPFQTYGQPVRLHKGALLQDVDWGCSQFYILLEGHLEATRQPMVPEGPAANGSSGEGGAVPPAETAVVAPGCLLSCAAFLSSTATRCKVVALEPATLVAFGWPQLESLVTGGPTVLMRLLLAASHALGPVIRRFISLGMNRVWLKSGDVPYRQGELAECLYVVISGRLRLVHESIHPVTQKVMGRIEDEVGRGEAVGAVWAITGGLHDTTALCVRDSELVRMSQAAFRVISEDSPMAMSKLFSNIARRLVAALDSRVRSTRTEKVGGSGVGAQVPLPPTGYAVHKGDRHLAGGSVGAGQAGASGAQEKKAPGRRHEIVTIAVLPAGQVPQMLPTVSSSGSGPSSSSFSATSTTDRAAHPGRGPSAFSSYGQSGSGTGYATDATGAAYAFETTVQGGPQRQSGSGTGRSPSHLNASLITCASSLDLQQLPDVASLIAVKRLANALKEALQEYGPVLLLNSTSIGLLFPTAFERLDVLFYRSKITSWMASQEEEYKFIVMEADVQPTPWSSVCVAQADSILLVAPENAQPYLGHLESALVFNAPPYQTFANVPSGLTPVASHVCMANLPGQHAATGSGAGTGCAPALRAAHSGQSSVDAPAAASRLKSAAQSVESMHGIANAYMSSATQHSLTTSAFSDAAAAAVSAVSSPPTVQSSHPSDRGGLVPSLLSTLASITGFGGGAGRPGGGGKALPPSPSDGAMRAAEALLPWAARSGGTTTAVAGSKAGSTGGPMLGAGGLQDYRPAAPGSAAPTSSSSGLLGQLGGSAGPAGSGTTAATLRRVELVLLHSGHGIPTATAMWLQERPDMTRHHHIRLSHAADVQRLARWIAGKAVGLVLSGGGSRGLAHLGVLCALEDQGVPVDVVGGTSQGAFMAALFAQGLSRDTMQESVRRYAQSMGSVRHLLRDLTLPILSVFSGSAFDEAIQQVFSNGVMAACSGQPFTDCRVSAMCVLGVVAHEALATIKRFTAQLGAQRIEDLWLSFFCVTTNLSRGEPSAHTQGLLWRLVRASMTIVGLLPPVYEEGDLLVDGGYMNNIPVDVMRSLGVDTVIVVDVENKDDAGWRNLTPYDGGVSGWHLLWDRWCPVPQWRFNVKIPKYSQIINQLTWMTHAHNLKRVAEDYKIDLYLRPPNIGAFKLMDYHLMDRIVKEAYRYAASSIRHFKTQYAVSIRGVEEPSEIFAEIASLATPGSVPAAQSAGSSVMCMTQLQRRQLQAFDTAAAAADGNGSVSAAGTSVVRLPPGSARSASVTAAGGTAAAKAAASAAAVLAAAQAPLQPSGKSLSRVPTKRTLE